ncbi:hypothetical protein K8I61_13945 [bacterium]|nr:hypothetical protein [bacterium]
MNNPNLTTYNVLVRIPVTIGGLVRVTHKWALVHRTHVEDGLDDSLRGVWRGVMRVTSFRRSLGVLTEANLVAPSLRLSIARDDAGAGLSDDDVRRLRDHDFLVGQRVEVYLLTQEHPRPGEASLFHVGRVDRGDVEIGPDEVVITCRDRFAIEDRELARERFADVASMDPRAAGRPVPILFGAWDREASDWWIPATIVDTALGSDTRRLRCRLARPGRYGLASFGARARWLDADGRDKRDETGYRELPIVVIDAGKGIFELAGSDFATIERRFAEGDRVVVDRPRGEIDAGGKLIERPADIVRHLLTDPDIGMDVPEADIDDASFDAANAIADLYGYRARAYLDEETTVIGVIEEIGRAFAMKLAVRRGRYAIVLVGAGEPGAAVSHVADDATIIDLREWNDRHRDGTDRVEIVYRKRPDDGAMTRARLVDPPGGFGPARRVESSWIYDDETAAAVGANWALAFGGVLRSVRLTADHHLLAAQVGEPIELRAGGVTQTFQIVETNHVLEPPVRVELDLITAAEAAPAGRWSADAGEPVPLPHGGGTMPADWAAASDNQRQHLSFWSDEDGEMPDGSAGKVWGR